MPRLTKSLKSRVLLDAGSFSQFKMGESKPPRLKKSLKSRVLLDAGAFSQFKMSESKPPRLTKSLKSRVLLDAGSFSQFKMGESKPLRLKKSLKSRVLLDAGSFSESKMSENAERPARSRPRNRTGGAADHFERVDPGRGTGQEERPTTSSLLIPAAEQDRRSDRPPRAS